MNTNLALALVRGREQTNQISPTNWYLISEWENFMQLDTFSTTRESARTSGRHRAQRRSTTTEMMHTEWSRRLLWKITRNVLLFQLGSLLFRISFCKGWLNYLSLYLNRQQCVSNIYSRNLGHCLVFIYFSPPLPPPLSVVQLSK